MEWAGADEPTDLGGAASWWEAGQVLPLAGAGAPEIAEYAVAEFATALGLTTDSGRRLIGHALELAYRLPGLWGLVQEGRVPVWRARRSPTPPRVCRRRGRGSWTVRSPPWSGGCRSPSSTR
ncbi:hypothetical protein [Nocardioides sp.]|uniref:hypothetical protein n=1 Tax=Nocardioides sp. TaxID=35761 RepID=UPI003527EF48